MGQPPSPRNVPESDLRPPEITDPVERFKNGMIGSLRDYRLQEVTRWYRWLHLYDDLVSLGRVGVDLQPHQVSVVHKVISAEYPHRFLLCDEVGLGKTIEAGMILKELRSRGVAKRVLIIVPPNLIRQWQFEMKTKFNENFSILNTATVRVISDEFEGNPFTYRNSVLCSSSWIVNEPWTHQCTTADWDLIIVDEAHHARRRRDGTQTLLYRLIRDLSPTEHMGTRGLLFLTATPMQIDTYELYSLVELLDPWLFPSENDFDRHCKAIPGLSRLVERLTRHGFPLHDEAPELTARHVAEWLDLEHHEAYMRLKDPGDRVSLTEDLKDRHRLSKVLIRNRKTPEVGEFMGRNVTRWDVILTPEERAAVSAVGNYVQHGYQFAERTNNAAVGFVMVIFQKLMASSRAAILLSLRKHREKMLRKRREKIGNQNVYSLVDLEERLEEDDKIEEALLADGATEDDILLLNQALNALEKVKHDSKANVLVEQLEDIFNVQNDEKVIVFTEFRETQEFLQGLLEDKGWGVNIFHGKLKPEMKDLAVVHFRVHGGPQVLISTEAGGEGRNFQFCHMLVNYDLPWNPMKIEQRIGRVDRIGQTRVVNIFNFAVKGTIEARILRVLENRIRVFEDIVGGLDPILGEVVERDIRTVMRASEEKRKAALEEFERGIEDRKKKAQTAQRHLKDFIMDTKSYRREIVERIKGQSPPINDECLEHFIKQLLFSVKTNVRRTGDIHDLTFSGEFYDTHRRIFIDGKKRRAVFRRARHLDEENVEFLAFGHPIVEAIVEDVLGPSHEGVTGTRRIPAHSGLAPITGWLFSFVFTVSGIRPTEHIEPVFVSDELSVDRAIGRLLRDSACMFDDREQDIEPNQIPFDNLDTVTKLAGDFASNFRQELQDNAERDSAGRFVQDVDNAKKRFDHLETAANVKLKAMRATLSGIQESDDEKRRRILPVWEARLRREEELLNQLRKERMDRINDLERRRYPQVAYALKSLGRIEVVSLTDRRAQCGNAKEIEDDSLRRLVNDGTIVHRSGGSILDALRKSVRSDGRLLSALLEERSEEYEEGHR